MSTIEEEIQRLQTAKTNIKTALEARGLTVGADETMSYFSADIMALPTVASTTVTGISLDKASATINVGATETLTATIVPDNATNKTVVWSSSNTDVATVANGVVTAVSAGSATITATSQEGRFTATSAITCQEVVVENYGTVSYYSVFEQKAGVDEVDGCTVNNLDTEVFLKWYNQLGTVFMCRFEYSEGVWLFDFEKKIEDMSAIGIDVTLDKGAETANISMVISYSVDKTGKLADFIVESETDYNKLVNNSGEDSVLDVNGGIPALAVKSFAFGPLAKATPTYFLGRCQNLESIDMSGATRLASIGEGFLDGNRTFNGEVEIPSTVTSIDFGFLLGCEAFNHEIVLPSGLTSIGSNFLLSCTSFNQPLTIPDSVTSIGSNFLSSCTSFNQPLTIPNGVTFDSLMGSFMWNCKNFIGPLTVETSSMPSSFQNKCDLATDAEDAAMYTTGITLTGTYAQTWKDALTDSTVSPYRKLIVES